MGFSPSASTIANIAPAAHITVRASPCERYHGWGMNLGGMTLLSRHASMTRRPPPPAVVTDTAFGGVDHWGFAPMVHLAFGEMV